MSKWTGIPVAKMLEGEMQKLVADGGSSDVSDVGQDEALSAGGECDEFGARVA